MNAPLPTDPFTLEYTDDAPPGPGRVVPSGLPAEGPLELKARYLGLSLDSPVVASASPMTGDLGILRALAGAGVGAVVLPSLFEEQIAHEASEVERMLSFGAEANPEATTGYVPGLDGYNSGADAYRKLVRAAKEAVDVPVIASLNGVTQGGWTRYARMLADEGADAIELNVYRVAADPGTSGRRVEAETLALVDAVAAVSPVPVAVKLSPYWSAFTSFAAQLVDAGAQGLVLFNRFYQPDIDLNTLTVEPHLTLSTSDELRLPLRWCAILHGRVDASLAATTGVHTGADVAKVLLAGANVAMTTSALLRNGPGHVTTMHDDLTSWMEERGYGSVQQMIGAVSQSSVGDPAAFERANYLAGLTRFASSFRS